MHRKILLAGGQEITRFLQVSALAVAGALSACSDGSTGDNAGAGGAALGGSVGAGGAVSGGTTSLGGASSGGSGTLGGTTSLGGASSGGATSGGASGASNGGAPSAGGLSGAGGSTGTSGGTTATGGATAMGGTTTSGGAAGSAGKAAGGTSAGGSSAGGVGGGGTAGTAGAKSSGGSAGMSGNPGGVVGQPIGFATLNGGTTGGKGGQVVTAKTFADFSKYAGASEPLVILVDGTITNGASGARVNVSSNKSIVGVGSTAFLQGVGLEVKNSNNVIIQNLKITLLGTTTPANVNGGDAIAINGTSKNVWIDHCEMYSEDPTVQTNVDKYDGLIDIRDQTGFVTVSWNYLHDHHKTSLVGASSTDLYADRKVTYHHNYMKKVIKRAPAEYRGAVGHFFNNYVIGTSKTEASFLLEGTCVRIEKNIYETVNFAIYTVASDGADGTKGNAERIDNIATQSRAWPPSCTANIPYEYDSALTKTTADVKTVVPAGAGVGKL